jgi:hypothetical protein
MYFGKELGLFFNIQVNVWSDLAEAVKMRYEM